MERKAKSIWKPLARYLGICAATLVLTGLLIYLTRGWSIAFGLRDRAERGEITAVQVTQEGSSITLTVPEDLTLAAGVAGTLTVALPGSVSQDEPETEYVFTFADGSQTRIGTGGTTVFRDGKAYRPKGENDCIALFHNMTEGLFFQERAVEH